MNVDLNQTLAQIYNLRAPFTKGPDCQASTFRSGLIDRCERLLVTPLRQYEPGDLRVMLHQRFYPETLVPLALPLVEHEPLLDAGRYPGDLLSSILHQTFNYWQTAPGFLARVLAVAELALSDDGLPSSVLQEIATFKDAFTLIPRAEIEQ